MRCVRKKCEVVSLIPFFLPRKWGGWNCFQVEKTFFPHELYKTKAKIKGGKGAGDFSFPFLKCLYAQLFWGGKRLTDTHTEKVRKGEFPFRWLQLCREKDEEKQEQEAESKIHFQTFLIIIPKPKLATNKQEGSLNNIICTHVSSLGKYRWLSFTKIFSE